MVHKKKVLLVMPNVPSVLWEWPLPPVGIPYVSAYMKKQGISVHCLNLCICDEPMKTLERAIRQEHIDIVATGDLVVNYQAVKEIIDCAKRVSPHIITIIGGGLVTHSPEEAMQLIPTADFGVIGEGEVTDCELVLTLESGGNPAQVAGIIYRDGDALCRTEPRAPIDDLDALPWPDYEGFDYFKVARRLSGDGRIAAALTTSRSCPFHCTFCSTSGGGKYRQRSLDSVFAELSYLVDHYHVKEVFLADELFAVDETRLHEFCRRIAPLNLRWLVYLRLGKHIHMELLREMHDAGCETIFYGLESANDTILKSMKKGTTEEEMLRVLEITKKAGIDARGGFIFGDTMETLETAEYTMNWVERHVDLIQNVTLDPIRLYPGSELYVRAVRSGRIPDTVQYIRDGCPQMNPSEQMDDETYEILTRNRLPAFVARLRRKTVLQNRDQLNERIIPESKDRRYIHTFTCQQCGKDIVEYLYPEILYLYHHAECINCGHRYSLRPGIALLQQYETEIFSQISKKGCAIWGAGGAAHDVYCNNAGFRDAEGLTIVDRSQWIQKVGFHGKAVISPERLPGLNVNKVFCFVSNANYTEIKRRLEGTDVKAVGLYEILFED